MWISEFQLLVNENFHFSASGFVHQVLHSLSHRGPPSPTHKKTRNGCPLRVGGVGLVASVSDKRPERSFPACAGRT
jgi:hypothetical protein